MRSCIVRILWLQLNEVESREETYPETLAFIRLVNKLLELCAATQTGPAAESGAAAAHIFYFVRDTVFLGLDRCVMPACTASSRHLCDCR